MTGEKVEMIKIDEGERCALCPQPELGALADNEACAGPQETTGDYIFLYCGRITIKLSEEQRLVRDVKNLGRTPRK